MMITVTVTVTVTVTFPAMAQVQVCESESRTRAAAELSMHSTCSEEVDWNTSLSPGRGSVTRRLRLPWPPATPGRYHDHYDS